MSPRFARLAGLQAITLLVIGVLVIPVSSMSAYAQSSDEEAVLAVVQTFFDAIATRDTLLAHKALLPEGLFHSIRDGDEGPQQRVSSHRDFVDQLTMPGDDWLERMWDPTVHVKGRIAVVWTPYDFHVNGEFSHCGIDAFTLLKTTEGWKISGTSYTVEYKECPLEGRGE